MLCVRVSNRTSQVYDVCVCINEFTRTTRLVLLQLDPLLHQPEFIEISPCGGGRWENITTVNGDITIITVRIRHVSIFDKPCDTHDIKQWKRVVLSKICISSYGKWPAFEVLRNEVFNRFVARDVCKGVFFFYHIGVCVLKGFIYCVRLPRRKRSAYVTRK